MYPVHCTTLPSPKWKSTVKWGVSKLWKEVVEKLLEFSENGRNWAFAQRTGQVDLWRWPQPQAFLMTRARIHSGSFKLSISFCFSVMSWYWPPYGHTVVLQIWLALCLTFGCWILNSRILSLSAPGSFFTHSCNSCAPREVESLFLLSVTAPFPALPSHQENLFLSSKCDL